MEPTDTRHTPRSLRARLDLTLAQVAEAAGVAMRVIQNLEAGLDVSLDTIRKVAPVLKVTFDELIGAIDTERERRAAESRAASAIAPRRAPQTARPPRVARPAAADEDDRP